MAGTLFSMAESMRSRSRQSSRNSFRGRGNGKAMDLGLTGGQIDANWFYDAQAPADGETTQIGRLLMEIDGNKLEEVSVMLQNGVLQIVRSAANAKNARPTCIALQDAHITPTSKLGIYAGIQIFFPSRDQEFSLMTTSEEDRDEWVSALRYNSLAHIRLRIDELSSMQSQNEADLREARRRAEEAKQQVQDLKHDFAAQKASLEHDKARLMEAYESMREKQENTEVELRAARHELEAAKEEIHSIKQDTQQQIVHAKQQLGDELRRSKSTYDAKIERLSREVSDREHQLHSISGDLQSAQSERHQSDQTVSALNREIRALKSKCSELTGQLDSTITKLRLSNEKREELQNNVIAAQAASERAHQKLAALSTEVKEHKSGRQTLEREVTGRRGQLSSLQQQNREFQRQIANLKGQLQVQRQESERYIKGLKESIQNKDVDLHKIHRSNVELEAKYEVLRAELREKNARLKGIQRSESRLNSRMSSFQPEFGQLLASYNSDLSDAQKHDLEKQLAAAYRKIQQLEENNAQVRDQEAAKVAVEAEENAKLRQKLKDTETQLQQQQNALTETQQRIAALSAENESFAALQEISERQKVEINTLQKQIQDFNSNSSSMEEAQKREEALLEQIAAFEKKAAEYQDQMHDMEEELVQTRQFADNQAKDKEDLVYKLEDMERELLEVQSRYYEIQEDAQRLQDQLTLERKSIALESQSLNRQRHNITVALKQLLATAQANSQAFDNGQQLQLAPPHTSDPIPLINLVEQVMGEIVAQRDSIQRELVALEAQSQQEHRKTPSQTFIESPSTLQDVAQTLNQPDGSPTAQTASPRVSGLRRAASEVNQRTIEREISLKMYIDLPPQIAQQSLNLSLPSLEPKVIEEADEEETPRPTPTFESQSKQSSKSVGSQEFAQQKERSSQKDGEHVGAAAALQGSDSPGTQGKGSKEAYSEAGAVPVPPTMRDLHDKLNQLAHQQAALEDELYRNSSVQKDLQIKLKELRAIKTDSLSDEESKKIERELYSIQEALEFTKDSVKQLEMKIHDRQMSAQSIGRRLRDGEMMMQAGDGEVGDGSKGTIWNLTNELADAEAESQRLKEMEQSAAKTAQELETLRKQLQEKDEILSEMHARESELMSEVSHLNQQLSKKDGSKGNTDEADSKSDARQIIPDPDDPEHRTQLLASYRRELGLRRQLHNMVLDLKGSIRVMTRLNPLLPGESQGLLKLSFPEKNVDPTFPTTVLQVDSEHDAEQLSRKYEFDRVFQPEEGTERIYQEMEGVLASVLEGYKVCLVCYGHNNANNGGGVMEDTTTRGIMWRAIQAIFREGQAMPDTEMKVSLSMVEVGPGSQLSDLLASNPHSPINNQIIMNKKQSLVSQFTRASVDSAERAQQALHAGLSQRNCTGGGSNLLYVVDVETLNLQTNVKCLGKLYIGDLVGTDGQDALGSLEVIITSLVMRSNQFLAGRRTPLTKLLYEAMGGNARVLLLTSISPSSGRESATMATLKFSLRAMAAELGPAVPIKKLPGAPTPSSHRMSPVYPYSSSNETQTEA